jgi:hypothetical protein
MAAAFPTAAYGSLKIVALC